jgi:hypothetical protein
VRIDVRPAGPTGPVVEQPPVDADGAESNARISLRLPETLEGQIEEAARAESVSVNTWLVRVAARALAGPATPPWGANPWGGGWGGHRHRQGRPRRGRRPPGAAGLVGRRPATLQRRDGRLDVVRGAVRSRAGSGSVRVGAAHGDVDLTFGSGPITVGVPEGVAAHVDVTSGSGQVHSELPVEQAPRTSDRSISVRARTGSGEVRLRRADAA